MSSDICQNNRSSSPIFSPKYGQREEGQDTSLYHICICMFAWICGSGSRSCTMAYGQSNMWHIKEDLQLTGATDGLLARVLPVHVAIDHSVLWLLLCDRDIFPVTGMCTNHSESWLWFSGLFISTRECSSFYFYLLIRYKRDNFQILGLNMQVIRTMDSLLLVIIIKKWYL